MRYTTLVFLVTAVFVVVALYVHRRATKHWRLSGRIQFALAIVMLLGAVVFFSGRLGIGIGSTGATVLSTAIVITVGFVGVGLAHVDALRLLRALGRRTMQIFRGTEAPQQESVLAPPVSDQTIAAKEPKDLKPGDPHSSSVAPNSVADSIGAKSSGSPVTEPLHDGTLGRRDLLRGATSAALVIGTGAGPYATWFGRHDYQLEERPVALPGLANNLDGYTIVQLSDIHVGPHVGAPELRAALALVRQARPDLIVLTGDLLDHDPTLAPVLGEFVTSLGELSRDGVAAVLGNHDHYADATRVRQTLIRAGAHCLHNDHRRIRDFSLVGVDDPFGYHNGGGPNLDAALEDAPSDLPRILLAHRPSFFEESHGRIQLQLSGHTHGGQLCYGYNPADFLMKYVRGHYEEGESQLYVNRGFGTAIAPARLGSPPEVTKVVLTV